MYLISSCLAGINCRYDGKNCINDAAVGLLRDGKAIAVCPELLAGLPVPRLCCEIDSESGKVINTEGQDLSQRFIEGAEKTLAVAKALGIKTAILKSKSPSCGYGCIYDGTFSGKLIGGNGVTAELLSENGIKIFTEKDMDNLK